MNVRFRNGDYIERFLLLELLICCLLFEKSVQGGIFGAPQDLYGPTDHVVVLNATSIKSTIYGKPNAWVVEFFSSWCGHCINFAPVYKEFAAEVEGWQTVVKVAGIDCADENNIPICREYEIMGYPSILFFPPNSPETATKKTDEDKPDLYRGERFQRFDKVSQLKAELIEQLTPHFSNILGDITSPLSSFVGVWKHVKNGVPPPAGDGSKPSVTPSLLILMFEKDKSSMGKELALLLSSFPEIRVLRFQQRNKLYERLGFKTDWPAAGYITADLRGGKFTIPKNKDIVTFLQSSALKMIKAEHSNNPVAHALAEGGGEKNYPDEVLKEENNLEEPLTRDNSLKEDVVSLEDLINAVRNSLRNEVGVLKSISGPKLSTLKQYVHVLGQLFPADRREMVVFLMKLDKYLDAHTDQLQINDYLDKLTELELELHPWDIDINSWGSCRGTVPGRRGYTCSLWRLFHTLTILATQKKQDIFVLSVIHGYVKEFFGCSECVQHFTDMVANEGALMINSEKDQALWLWKAHNKVNKRLKGSPSEDPGFPKNPYLSHVQCPSCQTEDGDTFDEDKVFDYLVKVYTHPVRTMQQVFQKPETGGIVHSLNHHDQSKQRRHTSSRFFSGTDYWIFCIVYLSVAMLLIFGYYHFKLGSSRRTRLFDPLGVCRKLIHSSRSIV